MPKNLNNLKWLQEINVLDLEHGHSNLPWREFNERYTDIFVILLRKPKRTVDFTMLTAR